MFSPQQIPTVDEQQYEPAFTNDLAPYSTPVHGFMESDDSPSFLNLYATSPLKSVPIPEIPVEEPIPESTEEIPGLGWSNIPSKPAEEPLEEQEPSIKDEKAEQTTEKVRVVPEEEDEEASLRAKLLRSLAMRTKLQTKVRAIVRIIYKTVHVYMYITYTIMYTR